MRRRVLIAALLAAPLSGCLYRLDIEVSGSGTAPVFSLRKPGYLRRPPVPFPGFLTVYESLPGNKERIVWRVYSRRASELPADARLTYGQPPPSLADGATQAEPLRPGGVYRVMVSGRGYVGAAVFAVGLDGGLITPKRGEEHDAFVRRMSALAPQNADR